MEDQLPKLMNTMAESVLEMTDRQAFLEVQESGREPAAVAGRVRNLLRETVRIHRQQPLFAAMEEYHRQAAAYQKKKREALPVSPAANRELLAAVFQRFPQMQNNFLTVQHREFKSLSDEDVASFLSQLELLGALDDGED